MGDGALDLVESLLGRAVGGGRRDRWEIVPSGAPVTGGGLAAAGRAVHLPGRFHGNGPDSDAPTTAEERIAQEVSHSPQITPASTPVRWDQENRMLQGGVTSSARVQRLTNHVVNVLLPRAREQKEARDKEAEKARKEAEEKAKREAEEAEKTKAEAPPQDAEEDVTMEGTEPATEANTERQAGASTAPSGESVEAAAEAMEGVTMSDEIAQVMELARALASGPPASEGLATVTEPPVVSSQAPAPSAPAAPTGPETSEAPAEPSESAAAPERVTIQIHGNPVDITETGIDPTFLEALPDDMREEVLSQHFREVRQTRDESQRATSQPAPSSISPEFLDALPPEIRAEVLQQEAIEQQRREREEARSRAQAEGRELPPAGPTEMDAASFLATLDDPTLRQSVLIEQLETGDDSFLSSLPPALLAEVDAIRRLQPRGWRQTEHPLRTAINQRTAAHAAHAKKPSSREPVQLLDKSGVAVLLRLLFFPQPLERGVLQNVLVNLCEHSKVGAFACLFVFWGPLLTIGYQTRVELINLLLGLLSDGTGSLSATDKSFSLMSHRASKALGTKATPSKAGKALESSGGTLPQAAGESVPHLVAQRSFDSLNHIIVANEQAAFYFLTEQEAISRHGKGLKKEKGKGKEKATTTTVYPLVILLDLLERPSLVKTPALLDSLTTLLCSITRAIPQAMASEPVASSEDAPPDAPATEALPTQSVPAQDTPAPTEPTGGSLSVS
jgi:E3 ubiquitin-protein ligase HUWE1